MARILMSPAMGALSTSWWPFQMAARKRAGIRALRPCAAARDLRSQTADNVYYVK